MTNTTMKKPLYLLAALLVWMPAAQAQDLSGFVEAETRAFPSPALASEQHESNLAVAFQPELYAEWARGYQSFTFTPYLRLDLGDPARTHFDVRELYYHYAARNWELKAGVAKVFWGVTESQHLVDIINQTDLVENPDGEDKLGQPMVNFTWIRDWGTLDFFVMPYFRERTFPGREGRLRAPFPVDTDRARYESDAEEFNPDLAVRWFHTVGLFDIGLSHFYGTSREPRLRAEIDESGTPTLIPQYDLIHQTGLDLQATVGGWLWKLETITRSGQGSRFVALTAGFEYTFSNLKNTGMDLGVPAEYLYDNRDKVTLGTERLSPTAFEDDLFVGARLALNDVQSTDVLGGAVIDRDTGTTAFLVEASRRIGSQWRLAVEARGFTNTSAEDILYGFRKDDYLQIGLAYHF